MDKLLLIVFSFLLTSCFSCKSQLNDSEDEITKMYLERMNRFQGASTPEEKATIYVDYITDDAIWMPQNQEVIHGKDEIFQWAIWFFSTYKFLPDKGEPKHEKSVIKGDMAYHRFTSKGIYVVIETGDTISYNQKYLDIMRKTNGEWKIACHMWNSNNTDESIWNLEKY